MKSVFARIAIFVLAISLVGLAAPAGLSPAPTASAYSCVIGDNPVQGVQCVVNYYVNCVKKISACQL